MSETLKELPAVARNINLPCKKCGVDRFHVVVAHKDSRTAKVKCEVCGSQKTLKIPSEAKRKSSAASKSRKTTSPAPSQAQMWRDLSDKIGTNSAMPYNLRHRFQVQTAIQHPKFGIGFITLATDQKIDVVFEDSLRSLVHNRP